MAVFLGNVNTGYVVKLLSEYGGVRDAAADKANAEQLILLWTLAGIIAVNAMSITLTMVGFMVKDEDDRRLSSFYVAPVNRGIFVMGYVLAALIMGIIVCLFTLIAGEIYVFLKGGSFLTASQVLQAFLYILVNVFMSASLVFFIINFVHSVSAFSGLSTVIGTLSGFLAAIYLPMGSLSDKLQTVLKCFPLLYGSSLLREVLTKNILEETFYNCPDLLKKEYMDYMGITVNVGNHMVDTCLKVAFMLISGIILIIISSFIQRKRITVIR